MICYIIEHISDTSEIYFHFEMCHQVHTDKISGRFFVVGCGSNSQPRESNLFSKTDFSTHFLPEYQPRRMTEAMGQWSSSLKMKMIWVPGQFYTGKSIACASTSTQRYVQNQHIYGDKNWFQNSMKAQTRRSHDSQQLWYWLRISHGFYWAHFSPSPSLGGQIKYGRWIIILVF